MGKRLRRFLKACYSAGLVLFPHDFRMRYASEMAHDFSSKLDDSRDAPSVLRLMVRTLLDLIRHSVGVRREQRKQTPNLRLPMFDSIASDLRFGLRSMARDRIFFAVALATIAVAIGVNSAMFGVVDAVLLAPLPYPSEDALLEVHTTTEGRDFFDVSAAEYVTYKEDARQVSDVGAYSAQSATVMSDDGRAELIAASYITPSIQPILGFTPTAGRLFHPEEGQAGAEPVALLGHGYWVSRFDGDRSIVGQLTIDVEGTSYRVVGVLEAGQSTPGPSGQVFPVMQLEGQSYEDRSGHNFKVIAKLAPSANIGTATDELQTLLRNWEARYAGQHTVDPENHVMAVRPLREALLGSTRASMTILGIIAAGILILAAANLSNMLLARGETRRTEMGVRAAIGAGAGRLRRQLITESLLLSSAGGLLGLIVGVGTLELLRGLNVDIPRLEQASLDIRLLGFGALTTLVAGVFFGLIPAMRAGKTDPATLMQTARGGSGSIGTGRTLRTLVVMQLTVAVGLVSVSGTLASRVIELNRVEPGFTTNGIIAFDVNLSSSDYTDLASVTAFLDESKNSLRGLPGVRQVAFARGLPLRPFTGTEGFIKEGTAWTPGAEVNTVLLQFADEDFFEVMGIGIADGRAFDRSDGADQPPVVILNRAAADRYYPDGSPVGQRIRGLFLGRNSAYMEVVGVAGDAHYESLASEPRPMLYLPARQARSWTWNALRYGDFAVSVDAEDPTTLIEPIKAAMAAVAPRVAVSQLNTLDAVVRSSFDRERFITMLVTSIGTMALLLAAVGVFGVLAFMVATRRKDICVQLALGQTPGKVISQLLMNSARLAIIGAAGGALITYLGSGPVQEFLGTDAQSWQALLTGGVVVTLAALVAAAIPALRASRLQPAGVLREE